MLKQKANRLLEHIRPWYLRHVYFRFVAGSKPTYFSACWNFPDFSLPFLGHVRDLAVVFWPMNDWHTRMQRTQHLARDLARRGFPIVYVNPHLGREFPNVFRPGESTRLLQIEPNLLELHVHLPREPVFHHRRLTPEESSQVASAVKDAIQATGARRVVQLAAFPVWLEAALAVRSALSAPLVYDCHDFLPGFSNIAADILAQEAELFRASDLILCTSTALMERAFALTAAPRVLLRNAAASEFFASQTVTHGVTTIGYAGALDTWFDTEALRVAAQARPQWRFELIGRVENDSVATLASLPNVALVGEVPFAELPLRLARFTVALIPFRLNPLIEATDPIKAYEYLACGLPVVASRLPELHRFAELISFYDTPADLVDKLDSASKPQTPAVIAKRRDFARGETWESRGATLATLLKRVDMSK